MSQWKCIAKPTHSKYTVTRRQIFVVCCNAMLCMKELTCGKPCNKYWYLEVEYKAKLSEMQEAELIQEYFCLDGEQI